MKYLSQVIVLHQHVWDLQEQINLLSRIQQGEANESAQAELHRKITALSSELVETLHAITILKEVKQ